MNLRNIFSWLRFPKYAIKSGRDITNGRQNEEVVAIMSCMDLGVVPQTDLSYN